MTTRARISIPFFLIALTVAIGCTTDDEAQNVFIDDSTGQWVIRHPENDRLWLRCDVGQAWNEEGQECTGARLETVYSEALSACPEGFSLPGNEDMATLLCNYVDSTGSDGGHRKYDPCAECSNCKEMFPEEKGLYFSSTTFFTEDDTEQSSYEFNFELGYVWLLHISGTKLSNVICIKDE